MTGMGATFPFEYEVDGTTSNVPEVTEWQEGDAFRDSSRLAGEMGRGLSPSLSGALNRPLVELGPLFTKGQIRVAETYGHKSVAAAMRRMNFSWDIIAAAEDRETAAGLLSDAELLVDRAYPRKKTHDVRLTDLGPVGSLDVLPDMLGTP